MVRTVEIILDNDYKLNIDDNTSILIINQISDIRDYTNRTNPYTLSFTIPGDRVNSIAFKHYNSLNTNGLNTSIKVPVKILESGNVFFSGYIQMNSSTTIDGKSQYQITCYSNLGNVIDSNLSLKDLDFSKWNHIFNYESVSGSWETFVWKNGSKNAFNKGYGYVYPYVDVVDKYSRESQDIIKTEFFKPYLYAKTIIDAIYEKLGLSYISNFINSDDFRSLIVSPDYSGFIVPLDEQKFKVGAINTYTAETVYVNPLAQTGTYGGFGNISTSRYVPTLNLQNPTFINGATVSYYNPVNMYNMTLKSVTFNKKQRNNFNAKIFMDSIISIWKDEYGTVIPQCQPNYKGIHECEITYYIFLVLNRGTQVIYLDSNSLTTPMMSLAACDNCITTDEINLPVSVQDYQFLPGDRVDIKVSASYKVRTWISQDRNDCNVGFQRDFLTSTRCAFRIKSGSYFDGEQVNDVISAGDEIDFNKITPDMSVNEFISSLSKMFNLVIYPYPQDSNKHCIEPYDDFFNSNGNINNWERKLDRRLELKKEPLSDISSDILLSYSSDNDYLNEKYENRYNETFGQKIIDISNDFSVEQKEVRIKFSPTPLVNEVQTDKIISQIYKYNNNQYERFYSAKPRILYYNYLPVNTWYLKDDEEGTFSQSNYPYAGFLDNPFDPNIDLNYWFCSEYYQYTDELVFNNLYNKYWSNYYGNIISSPDIITGYFKLTPSDMFNFDFRDLVYLDGNYYIVNKIEYDISNSSLTKVELIKVNTFDISDKSVNKTVSIFSISDEDTMIKYTGDGRDKSLVSIKLDNFGDFIKTNNDIKGYDARTSIWHTNNIIYGNNIFLSGENNLSLANNSSLNNLYNNLISGNNINNDELIKGNIIIGDNIGMSSSVSNSLLLGDSTNFDRLKSSIVVGDDINVSGWVENSIFFGSGYTFSTSTFSSNKLVWGSSQSGVFDVGIADVINTTNNISNLFSGPSHSIPFLSGSGLTTSNIFYYPSFNELRLTTTTASNISFRNTVGGGSLGNIAWYDTVYQKHSITTTPNLLRISAFTDLYLNVNFLDALKIGYGPNIGIINNASSVLFNISDNGWNTNLLRISSTSSVVMLNYNNDGILENRNHIKLGLTSSGYILKSPDGTDWKISVDNSGSLIVGTSI